MITNAQEILLKQYKEKAFINALLNEESCNYYNYIKNLINIPLIICNSVMVVINSMIENQDTLKILNIILNTSTGLIIGMISNFKIYERITTYRTLYIKYNKLSNMIDSKITNELELINVDFIENVVNEYNNIGEQLDYDYPSFIRKKIKKEYQDKMSLPLVLSVDIITCDENKCCCVKV